MKATEEDDDDIVEEEEVEPSTSSHNVSSKMQIEDDETISKPQKNFTDKEHIVTHLQIIIFHIPYLLINLI